MKQSYRLLSESIAGTSISASRFSPFSFWASTSLVLDFDFDFDFSSLEDFALLDFEFSGECRLFSPFFLLREDEEEREELAEGKDEAETTLEIERDELDRLSAPEVPLAVGRTPSESSSISVINE